MPNHLTNYKLLGYKKVDNGIDIASPNLLYLKRDK